EEPLDVTFTREFLAVSGNFIYCDGEIAVVENLIALVESLQVKKIYAWEPSIQQMLGHYGFPIYKSEADFLDAEVGITTCEALIDRIGSILLLFHNFIGRRRSIFPPSQLACSNSSQLVMDIKHELNLVKEKYGDHMPSLLSTITGPSRTADIEKK